MTNEIGFHPFVIQNQYSTTSSITFPVRSALKTYLHPAISQTLPPKILLTTNVPARIMNSLYNHVKDQMAYIKANRDDLDKLQEKYLQPRDRDLLNSEVKQVSNYTLSGALVGLGFGILIASRHRSKRTTAFNAFRAQGKPAVVVFADGRTGEW